MPSQESTVLSDLYRDWARRMAANPAMSMDDFRALFEEWATVTAPPPDVAFEEAFVGDIPVTWARPDDSAAGILLCLHGGGYVTGSRASHSKLFGHIASAAGSTAMIVDYRRAPENPYPAALDDALACYRAVLDSGMPPEQIAFVGDSAGGGLCIGVALAAQRDGLPQPGAIFVMSPWLDLSASGASYDTNAAVDLIVSRPVIQGLVPALLGEHGDIDDPIANPILADPRGLPPILIHVGGYESFVDDSRAFEAKAKHAGVSIELEIVPEMQHVFHFLAGTAPEADEAIQRAGGWLKARLYR
ncbi:Arylamidase/esterase [Novosphingobium resinovorum]|uniref:Arylamidase/esterase n=1 Tax=Novosphingobium resinovorum TaxID=158500 RepID=A0A031JQY6_9SPHN|nr:alpha/beta hydrolase [Novosphingobium resinovorum]EZP79320.1 Arylamidase/esterase [Novosphingobium resinovorum]